MIVGIGIDVCEIARLQRVLARTPALRQRLFTPQERDLPPHSLAGRFAVKEAVAKALGAPQGLSWTDAWVENGEHGSPRLTVRGSVAARANELGVGRWHVSISHDGGIATAFVIAETDQPAG